ncbi:DUF2971 domain-containing protein [Flavobacterium sp. SM2513]|uniref:DUF2971 domain-containing protein n=1 Tax=Flavobacterium sp. SM2513 TaxID=3424766 RepID=UPI003D7FFED2
MSELFENVKIYIDRLKQFSSTKPEVKVVEQGVVFRENRKFIIDAALIVNEAVFTVFEFKNTVLSLTKQEVVNIYELTNFECRFFVLSDGVNSRVYDTYYGSIDTSKGIEKLWSILFIEYNKEDIDKFKQKLIDEVNKEITTFKKNLNFLYKTSKDIAVITKLSNLEKAIQLFKDGLEENLRYDKNMRSFYITEDLRDLKNLENQFFKTVIEEIPNNTEIYRYTTLDSVFRTIEGKTLRLSGIVGMNDISEVGYVDGYLDKKYVPMATDELVNSVNKKYLMCSSTLEDELMQWRLYGDDCKGACLVFQINKGVEIPGLLLRKINYGIKLDGENFHPELEFIKRIKERTRNKVKVDFHFKTLSLWKHFFKSYEYEPEKEVRLLLIGNQTDEIKGEEFLTGTGSRIDIKWNLTNSHNILAPFIVLKIDDPRLRCKLTKVILGSKCPELAINLKQFGLLARKKNLSHLQIIPSKIINYR